MDSKTIPHQTNSLSNFGNLTFDLILDFLDDHYALRAANPSTRWPVPVTRKLDNAGFVIEKVFDIEDPAYTHLFAITGNHAIQLQLGPIGHPYYNNPTFPLVTTRVVTAEALSLMKKDNPKDQTLVLFGRSPLNAYEFNVFLHLHKLDRGGGFLIKRLTLELPLSYCNEWLVRYNAYRHQMLPSSQANDYKPNPKGLQEDDEPRSCCPCCGKHY